MDSERFYDDIIDHPHHTSNTHPRMDSTSRAAQFSPFAALVGYERAVEETARLTSPKITLSEDEREELDRRLRQIMDGLKRSPDLQCEITYFVPDEKKQGGAYVTICGVIKKVRDYDRTIVLRDLTEIPVDDILNIELSDKL